MIRAMLGRLGRRRDGQAMAEFAIIFPILLFLLVAIFEVGMAFRTFQIVTNGAREGARTGVVPTGTPALIQGRIDDYLQRSGLDPDLASTTLTCTGVAGACSSGSELRVELEYPYTFRTMGPVLRLICGACGSGWGTIPLRTTAVMRNE